MDIKPLIIGDLIAKVPIIQGGMGVGVSLSSLAGAVAKCGAIGVISAAQPGFMEEDFHPNTFEANLRALGKHIKRAKELSNGGIIGVNIMCAAANYDELVKAAINAGADIIISGAGLPSALPKLAMGTPTKLIPIVSSNKAASVILKLWDRNYSMSPDAIIFEGPEAGGHLGFKPDELSTHKENFKSELKEVLSTLKEYENKYNKSIPLIAAGGVFTGSDMAKLLKLGVNGVQMGTRFVATEECDAHINYKMSYVNCKKEDISIVKSPVGLPGRAIKNTFVEKTNLGNIPVKKCFRCLSKCNPATTPYCITEALINAVKGDVDNGLLFCGSNAYKIDKIVPVKELIDEIVIEAKNS